MLGKRRQGEEIVVVVLSNGSVLIAYFQDDGDRVRMMDGGKVIEWMEYSR